LVNVANRLLSALRGEDTACRFGGDEFALLLLGIESIEHCEETIKRVLSTITRSYHIGSQVFEITASCGITIYPEDSADLDTLIRHADQAMYDAKLTGRNQYKLFDQNVLIRKGNLSPLFQSIEKKPEI
jgi:diguanylate cyclase (GGDEF)-like protein